MAFIKVQKLELDSNGSVISGSASIVDTYYGHFGSYHAKHKVLRLSRNDHSQIRLIVTDLLFIMSPVRKEKTSESFVILRIILSEAGHQTVISITDYELVEIKKIVKKDKDGNEKSETLFGRE